MDPILDAANEHGVSVIEDAAQAIGSEYKGRRAGSIGRLGAFSFYPTKNLGAYGDGGLITTNDEGLAARLASLRVHGRTGTYFHEWIGINSRLDALQAAILRVKLRHLDAWSSGRARNADHYRARFAEMGVPVIPPQPEPYQTRHIYNQFVVRCERRDALQAYLKNRGIGCEVYYPLALHLQPCYAHLGYRAGDFPISERLSRTTLSLPVQAELEPAEIDAVCEAIGAFYALTT
jgi:dTDP-4-amino-4,6-dideoxygalactose transaminase